MGLFSMAAAWAGRRATRIIGKRLAGPTARGAIIGATAASLVGGGGGDQRSAGSNVVKELGPAPKGFHYSVQRYKGTVRLVKNRRRSKMPSQAEIARYEMAKDILSGPSNASARRQMSRNFARKFRF